MGEPMAHAVARAGFPLTASAHRNRAPLERLAALGVRAAAHPSEVASASEIVLLCVPDAPQVEEALFAARGVAEGLREGSIVVDMSTISPVASRRFAERLAQRGIAFVDAPVSGGPMRAQSGTLTIMVGASDENFARVRPLLEAMGTPHHLGPVGMGETVKLVNQIAIGSIMIANAEALMFAQKAGADLDAVREVLKSATASNYVLEQWIPKTWLGAGFDGGFAMDLLRKDLAAALDAARSMEHPMPQAALAHQLYTLQAKTDGARDYTAIAKLYGAQEPR
uniref:2-hydroxy-3-oxopropionate reductase (Tartronate semialdehyde reductase) (TSAR) n=1 Tax=mine drainage metagenome TaxID=410659 RepID=E6PIK1_9ZZZZ